MVRDNLATRDTDVGETTKTKPAISDSLTLTLTLVIKSNLFAVMLSGTMIMPAHKLARQARDKSTVARKFEADVPLKDHLVDHRSVGIGPNNREDRVFEKSCSSALTDVTDFCRSALGSEACTHQSSIYEKPPTALRRLRD